MTVKTWDVVSRTGTIVAVFASEEKAWAYIDLLALLNGESIYNNYFVDTTVDEEKKRDNKRTIQTRKSNKS